MKKYKLAAPTDPVLWTSAPDVTDSTNLQFVDSMIRIFRMDPTAVGLAAPQIGVPSRVVLIWQSAEYANRRNAVVTLAANPVIQAKSLDTTIAPEGCLLFPKVSALVCRHNWIEVQYQPIVNGKLRESVTRRVSDWCARIWQHEIDHLNGICRVGNEWRRQNLRRLALGSRS